MTTGRPVMPDFGSCVSGNTGGAPGRESVERELYDFPSIRLLVARDAAHGVDELALVPLNDLFGALRDCVRQLVVSAEEADRDDRYLHRLGRVELVSGPELVRLVQRGKHDDDFGVLDLGPKLVLQRLSAAGRRSTIGIAHVLVEKVRRAFEVLEDTV